MLSSDTFGRFFFFERAPYSESESESGCRGVGTGVFDAVEMEKNELVSKENKHCKEKHTFWFGWLLLFGCFLLSKLFIGVGTIV